LPTAVLLLIALVPRPTVSPFTKASLFTCRRLAPDALDVPIPTFPLALTNNRPVPLVEMATWSAPGENMPEFLSVAKAMAGAAAVPRSKALVIPLTVTLLLGLPVSSMSLIKN